MTTDATISTDLAKLGAAASAAGISVEETLRRVGAVPAGPRPAVDLGLVIHARLFSLQIARIVSGSFLAALTTSLVLLLLLARDQRELFDDNLLGRTLRDNVSDVALVLLGLAAVVHLLTERIAAGWLLRVLRGAPAPARRARALVQRTDGLSLAVMIASTMIAVLFLGMAKAMVGDGGIHDLWLGDHASARRTVLTMFALLALLVLFVASVGGALVASWHVRKATFQLPLLAVPLAVIALVIVVTLGIRADLLTIREAYQVEAPARLALRSVLTLTGSISIFVIVTAWAARRRRRER